VNLTTNQMQTNPVRVKQEPGVESDQQTGFQSGLNPAVKKEEEDEDEEGHSSHHQGSSSSHSLATASKKSSRKVRRGGKVDMKAKLERSRQSARECRARKKLRYQYLEDLVTKREKSVLLLKKELEMVSWWLLSVLL